MDDDMMISEFMKESMADPRFQNLMMLVKTRSLKGRSREDVGSELRALLDECMKKVMSRHGFTVPGDMSSAVAANLTAVTSASQPTGQRKVVVKSDKLSSPSADGEKSSPATTTFKDVIERNDRNISGRSVAQVSQKRNTNVYKELLASIKESKKQALKESSGSNRKGTEFTEVKMKKIFRYMAYKNEDSDSEEEDLAKFANPFARYRMKLKSPYSHGQTAKTGMDEMPVLNLGSYMQGPVKSSDQESCPDTANTTSGYNLDQLSEDGMDKGSSPFAETFSELSDDKKTASMDTVVNETDSERCSDLSSEKSVHNLNDSVPPRTTDVKLADLEQGRTVGEVRPTPSDEEVTPEADPEWCPDAANNASVYKLDQPSEDGMDYSSSLSAGTSYQLSDDKKTASMDTVVDEIASESCSDLSSEKSVHNLNDSIPLKTTDVKLADLVQGRSVGEVSPTPSDEEVTPETDLEWCPDAANNASVDNLDQLSEDEMDNSSSLSAGTSYQLSDDKKTASMDTVVDEIASESCLDLSTEISVHNLDDSVPLITTDVKPADVVDGRSVEKVSPTPSDEEVTPDTDPEWCPDAANNASVYNLDQCSEDGMDNSSSSSDDTSCNKTLKEELLESCIAKGMRRQFISDRYLEALVNLHKTKAELRARKPEPRVKIEKPVHLDTDLMYSVRQSMKRSLPKVAGKNNLSALMMMADGMFQEMSLDRGLDELAWPYDPLAELRESGLALVDYMEPTSNVRSQLVTKSAESPLPMVNTSTPSGTENVNISKEDNKHTHMPSSIIGEAKLVIDRFLQGNPTAHENGGQLKSPRSHCQLAKTWMVETPVLDLCSNMQVEGIIKSSDDLEWYPDVAKNASVYNLDQLSEDGMDNSSSLFAGTSNQLSDDKITASMDTVVNETDSERCSDLSSEKSVHNLNDSVPPKTTDVKSADLEQERSVGEVSPTPSDEEVTPETDPEWCPDAANNASVYNLDQLSEDGMDNSSSPFADTSNQLSDDKKTASMDTIVDEIASERCSDLSSEKSVHNLNDSVPLKTTDVKPADVVEGRSVEKVSPTPSDEEVTPETDLKWCPDAANNASVYNLDQRSKDGMDNSSSLFAGTSNQLSDDKKTASMDTVVDEIASESCLDLSSEISEHNLNYSVPIKTTDVKPAEFKKGGSVGEVRPTPSDEEVTPETDLEWCPDAANNASVYNLDQLSEDGIDNSSSLSADSFNQLSDDKKTASMDTVMDEVDSESCLDRSSEISVHNLDDSIPLKTIDVKPADLEHGGIEGEVSPTPSDEEVTPETDPEWCPDAANNASVYNLDQCSEDGMDNSSSSSDDTSCNKTLKEELLESCIAKGMRRQFISDRYLEALVNLHKTKAELRARKPEPRVKIEKPVHLDTDLMYSVRQSMKRSLPKVAGKNNLSALMLMADGMFQEMSLDRGLDELAWPYDPLAELRESGLALVDYMEPTSPPNNSIEHVRNISQQEETPPRVQDATAEISDTPRVSELTTLNLDLEEDNKEESSAVTDMMIPSILSTNVQGPTVETSVSDIQETLSEEISCENINVIDHTTDDTGSGFVDYTSDGLDELQQADVITSGPMEQYPLTLDLKFEETPSDENEVLSDDSALGCEGSISSLDDTFSISSVSSGYEDPSRQNISEKISFFNNTTSTSFIKQPTISAFIQDVSVSSAVHLYEKIAVEEKSSTLIPAANLNNEQMQQDRDVQKAILHFEEINKVSKEQLQPELNQSSLIPAAKANNEKIPEHGDTKETILHLKEINKVSKEQLQPKLNQSLIPAAKESNEKIPEHGETKETILHFEEIKNATAVPLQPESIQSYNDSPKKKFDIRNHIKMFETMSSSKKSSKFNTNTQKKSKKGRGGLLTKLKVAFFEKLSRS